MHSLSIIGLADDPADPTDAVQFAVQDPNGQRFIDGDQRWIAYGQCIRDGSHPNGRIQRRAITITYGEWEDA